jgi:hypothetical protein
VVAPLRCANHGTHNHATRAWFAHLRGGFPNPPRSTSPDRKGGGLVIFPLAPARGSLTTPLAGAGGSFDSPPVAIPGESWIRCHPQPSFGWGCSRYPTPKHRGCSPALRNPRHPQPRHPRPAIPGSPGVDMPQPRGYPYGLFFTLADENARTEEGPFAWDNYVWMPPTS